MPGSAIYPSLANRSVFITGGATGIGAALVEAFLRQQSVVGFIDIADESAKHLADRLEAEGLQQPWYLQTDVTDIAALRASIDDFASVNNGLGILINNVANDTRHEPLDVTGESWRACMAVNLDSAFFASQSAIRLMRETGGGSIINFSSINAILGPAQMPGYVSAKAALLGMTKALARQYGPDRIRVNAILPGWVVTGRQLERWLTPEAEKEWMEQVALKQRILPEEVAKLALFLASDDSAMITSQQFIIDGGRI